VEGIRAIDGLRLEELEGQTLDLLPDREVFSKLFSINNVVTPQINVTNQLAISNALFDSEAVAGNAADSANKFTYHYQPR
jgi:hypothetical protein